MAPDLTVKEEQGDIACPGTSHGRNSWSLVLASLLFSAATYEMLVLYGVVHWQIMFRVERDAPRPPEAVFAVLGHLGWLRIIFALLAFIWAVWSFRSCPRWASLVALMLSIAALMTIGIIM